MKKTITSLLALGLVLTACGGGSGGGGGGQNPPDSKYYMRLSIDGGAPINFPNGIVAFASGNDGLVQHFGVLGLTKPADQNHGFPHYSIDIWANNIQAGQTYTLPLLPDTTVGASYNLDGYDRYEATHVDEKSYFITIDSLSKTEVKGHFGGKQKHTLDNAVINVTGEFYAPIAP